MPSASVADRLRGDDGSQAMEFAMVLPLVALLVVGLVAVGGVAATALRTHALAVELARAASVDHDDEVVGRLVDQPWLDVTVDPPSGVRQPGDPVTVRVATTLSVPVLSGVRLPLTASATTITQDVP